MKGESPSIGLMIWRLESVYFQVLQVMLMPGWPFGLVVGSRFHIPVGETKKAGMSANDLYFHVKNTFDLT